MSEIKEVLRWKMRLFMRNGDVEAVVQGPLTHSAIEVVKAFDFDAIKKERDDYRAALEEINEWARSRDHYDNEIVMKLRSLSREVLAKHGVTP